MIDNREQYKHPYWLSLELPNTCPTMLQRCQLSLPWWRASIKPEDCPPGGMVVTLSMN
jgi:hypothetical protein